MEYQIPQRAQRTPARALPRRLPSARGALLAGLVGGAVALVLLELFAVTLFDEPFWRLPRMLAAMVRGADAIEPDDEFDAALVAIALALWTCLSLLYSFALACLLADTPRRYAAWMGLAFGIALYFVNFHGFTVLFPWFTPHRTLDTLCVHAIYGLVLARAYWVFRRRGATRR